MPIEHVIYIPGVLLLGLAIGYVLGAKAVRSEVQDSRKRSRQ